MTSHNKLRIVLAIVIVLVLVVVYLMTPDDLPEGPATGLVPGRPLTLAERQMLEFGTNATPFMAQANGQALIQRDPIVERNRRDLNIMFNASQAR